MTSSTTDWYDVNASDYCAATIDLDLEATRTRFLAHIPCGGRILDIGCGSGRDSLQFSRRGFSVDARDRSSAMADEARRRTGIAVRVQDILTLADEQCFEGVWACAVLLHLTRPQFVDAVQRSTRALVPSGALFLSVKRGSGTHTHDGRSTLLWATFDLIEVIDAQPGVTLVESWETNDSTRPETTWINMIARRDTALCVCAHPPHPPRCANRRARA